MLSPLKSLALIAVAAWAAAAQAADPFTDAMTEAYAPYRAALFRTNSKAQAESVQAIAAAQAAWRALAQRFGATPPPPYDRDEAFAQTLAKVSAVYDRAALEIADKRLAEAHETLEQARDLMSELRRRNAVITFSDHMNAYHAQMEHVLDDGPALLDASGGVARLTARVGALDYLAGRLRSEAPSALAKDTEFDRLVGQVQASVAGLRDALIANDVKAARDALKRVKRPYSQLFLKFG